jgi:hypothetical protein
VFAASSIFAVKRTAKRLCFAAGWAEDEETFDLATDISSVWTNKIRSLSHRHVTIEDTYYPNVVGILQSPDSLWIPWMCARESSCWPLRQRDFLLTLSTCSRREPC